MANRTIDLAALKNIMNSRALITASMAEAGASDIKGRIQGNGNVIDVTDAQGELVRSAADPDTVLQKKIFNLKANSALAMALDVNKDILKRAVAAEKAGQPTEASELYSEYLNKVQVSFSILLPSKVAEQLTDGTQIRAKVERITTEKGSLLTLDPKTVAIVEAAALGATDFNIEDFLEAETPETTPPAAPAKDAKKVVAQA